MALARTEDGVAVTLTTGAPAAKRVRSWDLFLDFRPAAERFGAYGAGTWQYKVYPPAAPGVAPTWRRGVGAGHPPLVVAAAPGGAVTARFAFAALPPALRSPASFGFAVTLSEHDPLPDLPDVQHHVAYFANPNVLVQAHLFATDSAPGLNAGWANVQVDAAPPAAPTIVAPYADLPAAAKQAPRATLAGIGLRQHPLTAQPSQKFMIGGFGCGSLFNAAALTLTRAGHLVTYDFADDSGVRAFGGVRPSCGVSMMAAQGMGFIANGGAGCECTFNFLAHVGLAAADRRLNEDWALFFDWPAELRVRRAALNLGAPGDRRDDAGTLWLGFPRPSQAPTYTPLGAGTGSWHNIPGVAQQRMPVALPVPLTLTGGPAAAPYRVSADRVAIAGTDRPWLYASGYRDLRTATLKLESRAGLVARRLPAAPTVDGKLDEPAWAGAPAATLGLFKATVRLGFDDTALYLAIQRAAVVGPKGDVRAWTGPAPTKGSTAVWQGDSCEVFLSDAQGERVVHLGVGARGARCYDLLEPGKTRALPGAWASSADPGADALSFELALPFATLAAAGLARESLALNVQVNETHNRGEAIVSLGGVGRDRCANFLPLGFDAPPPTAPRPYTVRLHFAELGDVAPGARVFAVKLQGQVVVPALDVVKEAGGPRRALVREFPHVLAADALTLELVPSAATPDADRAPFLSALEVFDETLPAAAAKPAPAAP